MATERPRFTISLSDDLLEKVEAYKEQNHFSVRSKAVEALIAAGVDSLIEKGVIPNVHNPPSSRESLEIAAAYDRADEKSRKMARLALEDFMETPVPAMAKRRTERTAADDNPSMDTWHIRDAY